MINISHPPTSLHIALGNDSRSPSASLDFKIADTIAMGAKLHIPGPWLEKSRASLSPLQQKLFDAALNVLGGKEAPRSVQQTADGRTIQFDRIAYGATTLSIGFHASASGVLDFFSMLDSKGSELLTLGKKMATAFLGPASSSRPAAPSLPPRRPQYQSSTSHPLAARHRNGSAPALPLRPMRTPPPHQQPSYSDQNLTSTAPPLPPRPPKVNQQPQGDLWNGDRTPPNGVPFVRNPFVGRRAPYEDRAQQPPPFSAKIRGSSLPDAAVSGTDPFEAHVAEELFAQAEEQQMPKPGMKPRLSQAGFEAHLNGQPAPTQRQRPQSAPPRPPKEPFHPPPQTAQGTPETAKQTHAADEPRAQNDEKNPHVSQEEASTRGTEPKLGPDASSKVGEPPSPQEPVKLHYSNLGFSSNTATSAEIRSAYKKLALQYHPDKNPGNQVGEEIFKTVAAAYEFLSDENKRNRYNAGLIDDRGKEY